MEPSSVGAVGEGVSGAVNAAGPTMGTNAAWAILVCAGLLEVGMALGIRSSDGFTKLWPSAVAVVFGAASVYLLSLALRVIPAGVGYAAWTGIGATGVMLVGVTVLKEPATAWRFVCAGLIVAGVAGLHAGGRGQ